MLICSMINCLTNVLEERTFLGVIHLNECVFDKKLFAAVIKCFIDNWTCVKKEKFPEEYDILEDFGSFGMASKQMVVICLDNIHFSLFLTHY